MYYLNKYGSLLHHLLELLSEEVNFDMILSPSLKHVSLIAFSDQIPGQRT